MSKGPKVAFTVDLEPDCPPFLSGFRGVEQGLPALLDLLATRQVRATFFTTGEVAERFPRSVERVVSEGHELACHGMTHTAFTTLGRDAAREEIVRSATILRRFAPVTSFRAPYLKFPLEYVELLEAAGFAVDSSQAKYKAPYLRSLVAAWMRSVASLRMTSASTHPPTRPLSGPPTHHPTLPPSGPPTRPPAQIPASVTSSVLRLPNALRRLYLAALSSPVVLFVHPWEFVDLRREPIRLDCRFKTGDIALRCVDDVLAHYARRDARFVLMRDLAA